MASFAALSGAFTQLNKGAEQQRGEAAVGGSCAATSLHVA